MIAEVAIGQRIHEVLGQGLEQLGRTELRNALVPEAAANWNVHRRHGEHGRSRKRAVAGNLEVHVEIPHQETGPGACVRRRNQVEGHEVVGGSSRRRALRPVPIRRKNAALGVAVVVGEEADHFRRRIAGDHLGAVEGVSAAVESGAEEVRGHVVGVRPDAELRVVGEIVADEEVVQIPGARGVTGLGNRKALVGVGPGNAELRREPAIGLAVVLDDRVAVIRRLAHAPETLKERVSGKRAEQQGAGLVVDRPDRVDVHHELVLAHVAVDIGRNVPGPDGRLVVLIAQAFELAELAGRRQPLMLLRHRIDDLVTRAVALRRRHVVADRPLRTGVERQDHFVVSHRYGFPGSHSCRGDRLLRNALGFLARVKQRSTSQRETRSDRDDEGRKPFRRAPVHTVPPFD